MFIKSGDLKKIGIWLAIWGFVKTIWDTIGHIGNVQTLWDMISAAIQYWPSFLRAIVWVATSWWLPLIASTICLLLWWFLSGREKKRSFAAVTFDDAIIVPSGRDDGTAVLRHRGASAQAPAGSRIRISCGKSVEKSVVSADGEIWYRARLDLERGESIPDLEAIVTELWKDELKVRLQENLVLTMNPGMLAPYPKDRNMRTLTDGCPEFIDVIRVGPDKIAHFPLKFYPRAVDHPNLLKPQHAYKVAVVIRSPAHQTLICTFEFQWTGDTDTSDIRLLSVRPPL